jgi:hypothetical protein
MDRTGAARRRQTENPLERHLRVGHHNLGGTYREWQPWVHILTSGGTVQVFTSKTPFFQIGNDIVVLNKVLNGERPPKPVDCESVGFSDELWDVVERAWAAEPESRASLADFIKVLGGK